MTLPVYFTHFHDHIGPEIPFKLQVEAAIGLFHVHAHKDKCFFRYATSFIPGASVIAAEILESLWSSLNSISPTARTATLAHWAEMLDDHVLQFLGLQFFLFCFVYLCLFIIPRSESWRCCFDSLLFDSYRCHTIDS